MRNLIKLLLFTGFFAGVFFGALTFVRKGPLYGCITGVGIIVFFLLLILLVKAIFKKTSELTSQQRTQSNQAFAKKAIIVYGSIFFVVVPIVFYFIFTHSPGWDFTRFNEYVVFVVFAELLVVITFVTGYLTLSKIKNKDDRNMLQEFISTTSLSSMWILVPIFVILIVGFFFFDPRIAGLVAFAVFLLSRIYRMIQIKKY